MGTSEYPEIAFSNFNDRAWEHPNILR